MTHSSFTWIHSTLALNPSNNVKHAMNLGKTWMGHMFKKVNKIVKKDNVGIKVKYINLLK